MSESKLIGMTGEQIAAEHLLGKGYVIRELNFRTRFGEIDIIAQKNGTIVFVEVKTRTGNFLLPREAVDAKKQQKLRKTAQIYLAQRNEIDCFCRFDVVEVMIKGDKRVVEQMIDAF